MSDRLVAARYFSGGHNCVARIRGHFKKGTATYAYGPIVGRVLSAIFWGMSGLAVVDQTSYGFVPHLLVHVHGGISRA